MSKKSPLIKIGDTCKVFSGGTPRRGIEGYYGGDIPWAKIGDIETAEDGYLFTTKESITQEGLKSINNKIFKKDTIFLALYGSVGKTAIAGREMSTNQAILGLIPKNPEVLYFKYLKYWLDYSKSELIGLARGVALQNISATIVKEYPIPLQTIEEQNRIVKILDRAQSLIEKRKQAISCLDDYIKAVFLDMFGDPVSNPKGWEVGKIGDLVSEINYGTSAKAGSIGKFPYLRMNNITYNGEFNLIDLKYIDLAESDINKYTVSKGDLLFNRTNSKELVGKTAVVNFGTSMAFAGYLIRVRTNKKAIPEYISGYLNSKHGKATLMHMCKSIVGMANINAKELQKIRILIPSVETQEHYKKIYDDMLSLKQKMQTQLKELEDNFQAQLRRAFRGE